MVFKSSALCCLIGWALGLQLAQAEFLPDVPPPTAPWVSELPDKARWLTVGVPDDQTVLQASGEGQPAKTSSMKIESIVWNAVKSDTVYRDKAQPTTLIYYSGFVLVDGKSSTGERIPVLVQQIQGTDYSNLRSTGWLGTEWVGEKTYLGAEVYQRQATRGQDGSVEEVCYLYRKPAASNQDQGYYPEVKAWIRASDKMPVAVSIDEVVFEFELQDPPLQPPAMSGEQASKLMDLKDRNDRMIRLQQRAARSQSE